VNVISHQTVRLEQGRHASPAKGMCVMELASVLAGEPFSDHPRAVSPVIGCLLRTYNDVAGDERRQALIPYAAAVVGTRGEGDDERRRASRCITWAIEHGARLPRRYWRLRRMSRGRRDPLGDGAAAARWALATLRRPEHHAVLELLDELIALGPASDTPPAGGRGIELSQAATGGRPSKSAA
jgi:hypothetical protein